VYRNICLRHWLKSLERDRMASMLLSLWSSKNGQQGTQEAQTAAPFKGDGRATVREIATLELDPMQ
jgi:hypothetical protein